MVYRVNSTVVIDDSKNFSNIAAATVTGTVTAATFSGDGSGLTGLSSNTLESNGKANVYAGVVLTENNWTTIGGFLAIKSDGTLWAWGENSGGKLGLGDVINRSSPVQVGSLTNWSKVTNGYSSQGSARAIKSDGTLWAWGANNAGQLGDGTTVSKSSPVQIGAQTYWSEVFASQQFTMAITTTGALYSWGYNFNGNLGLGNTTYRSSPVQLGSDTWTKVTGVGSEAALGIKTNGTLWYWGSHGYGTSGSGVETASANTPTQVGAATDWVDVVGYFGAVNAIRTGGQLWTWGGASTGQLATGNTTNRSSPVQVTTPNVTWVSLGGSKQAAPGGIDSNGNLWMWGYNIYGAVGDGSNIARSVPVLISSGWSKVNGTASSTSGLKSDGTIWSWGYNNEGDLGLGNITAVNQPQQILGSPGKTVLNATGNSIFEVSLTTNAVVSITGVSTSASRLSILFIKDNSYISRSTTWPSSVKWSSGTAPSALDAPGEELLVTLLTADTGTTWYGWYDYTLPQGTKYNAGKLYAWGSNSTAGLLGLGDTLHRSSPTLLSSYGWTTLKVDGFGNALAVRNDGTLWGWGGNSNGRLGLGDTANRSSPVQVGSDTNWVNIATSTGSFGVKTNGTLWSWGDNSVGQLGDGTKLHRSSPVQVGSLTDWSKERNTLHTNYDMCAAVKTDGTLWTWGNNASFGRLGQGALTLHRSSPVQLGTATNWRNVSVNQAVFAVTSSGDLYGWGENGYGQVGDGTVVSRSSPVLIGGGWVRAVSGDDDCIGVKINGTLWGWGRNLNGQIGDGTTISKSTPVQIGNSTNWTPRISAYKAAFAVKTDGTLWAWGNGAGGALGLNSTASKSSPTQIGSETVWVDVQSVSGQGGEGAAIAIKAS